VSTPPSWAPDEQLSRKRPNHHDRQRAQQELRRSNATPHFLASLRPPASEIPFTADTGSRVMIRLQI
jgi:predicted nicotinamide N-methyase